MASGRQPARGARRLRAGVSRRADGAAADPTGGSPRAPCRPSRHPAQEPRHGGPARACLRHRRRGLDRILAEAPPQDESAAWDFRFLLAQLAAITAVLGAVVAFPVTLNRLRLSHESAARARDALYNDKINAALNDLHAMRQRSIDDDSAQTIWEADVNRRNGAIDRLEALAHENPADCPRIARMLATYVRELSREYPPISQSESRKSASIQIWAWNLKPPRSDMTNAAKTLGQLLKVPSSTPEALAINLDGANLQRVRLGSIDLRKAQLSGAHLQGADLRLARLDGAGLTGIRLEGAFLHGAHLNGAFLDWAHLEHASLNGAQMVGAHLNEAHLEHASLDEADLTGANLHRAHLDGAFLGGTALGEAVLTDARLERAFLGWAHLRGAVVGGAHLDGTGLYQTRLDQLNESHENSLTQEQIRMAFGDASG